MAPRRILFVDDDLRAMVDHVAALLEAGFLVTKRESTDATLEDFLGDKSAVQRFDLIILDMMLPPPTGKHDIVLFGRRFELGIWEGLRSGGHLLAILRDRMDKPDPPVLLLSQLLIDEVVLEAWDQFRMWCASRKHVLPAASTVGDMRAVLVRDFGTWVEAKRRTPPWHLPVLADRIIGEFQKRS